MTYRHPYSLIGIDGNAYSVLGYTIKAMRQCGYSENAIETYRGEAISSDYDHLLNVSLIMINNCNKLSGFDNPDQQFMKGSDDLDYVDNGFSGIQNKREKLINEELSNYISNNKNNLFNQFKNDDFENEYNVYDDEYQYTDDYMMLYNAIKSGLIFILNNVIALYSPSRRPGQVNLSDAPFTKIDVKDALIDVINDSYFWEELSQPVPNKRPLNESTDKIPLSRIISSKIKSRLAIEFDILLDDGINFSKYDVYHIFLELFHSQHLWSSLTKNVK